MGAFYVFIKELTGNQAREMQQRIQTLKLQATRAFMYIINIFALGSFVSLEDRRKAVFNSKYKELKSIGVEQWQSTLALKHLYWQWNKHFAIEKSWTLNMIWFDFGIFLLANVKACSSGPLWDQHIISLKLTLMH